MTSTAVPADLAIRAMQKLDPLSGERRNVTAFIESCYCGRARSYDLPAALEALNKLTDEEQHALIACAFARHGTCRG
jgi:hypothetical protein